ncbi:MAG: methionine biosynthesis protein MetW, partial [Candidatus Omnitrophica bacterium]|nr:methionine biosynthesis protein MetW [Candidatus Omnitrophota bacterium]
SLPYRWYDTPNLHFLSLTDFIDFCHSNKITILKKYYLGKDKKINFLPNLFALNGIFVISA